MVKKKVPVIIQCRLAVCVGRCGLTLSGHGVTQDPPLSSSSVLWPLNLLHSCRGGTEPGSGPGLEGKCIVSVYTPLVRTQPHSYTWEQGSLGNIVQLCVQVEEERRQSPPPSAAYLPISGFLLCHKLNRCSELDTPPAPSQPQMSNRPAPNFSPFNPYYVAFHTWYLFTLTEACGRFWKNLVTFLWKTFEAHIKGKLFPLISQ